MMIVMGFEGIENYKLGAIQLVNANIYQIRYALFFQYAEKSLYKEHRHIPSNLGQFATELNCSNDPAIQWRFVMSIIRLTN